MASYSMPVPPATPSMHSVDQAPLWLEVVELNEDQLGLHTSCAIETFANYELEIIFFPDGASPERIEFAAKSDVEAFREKKGVYFLGIFSPDKSTLISTARWRLEDEDTFEEPPPPPEKRYPPGCNQAAMGAFFGNITKARKEEMGRTKFWRECY